MADLSALTDVELADRWGATKRKLGALEDDIEALQAEFDVRGKGVLVGLKYSIVKSTTPFKALDIKRLRAEMGAAWCKKYEEPRGRTQYLVNPVPAKPGVAS